MAEGVPITSASRRISITGAPRGMTPEQARLIVDSTPPGFSGSYEQALQTLPSGVLERVPTAAPSTSPEAEFQVTRDGSTATVTLSNGQTMTLNNVPEGASEAGLANIAERGYRGGIDTIDYAKWARTDPNAGEPERMGDPNAPRVDATGVMGEFVRGMGDEAAAAATGATIGSVVPGVGTAAGAAAGLAAKVGADAFSGVVNLGARFLENFSTEENPIEVARMGNSDQLWNTMMDKLNVGRADTPAEEILATGFAAGGDALAMALGLSPVVARNIVSGSLPSANPSTVQRVAQTMGTGPVSQTTGAIAGEAAGEGLARAAESQGMDPWLQEALRFGGGFLGDMLMGGTVGAFADNRLAAGRINPAAAPEFTTVNDINTVYAPETARMPDGTPLRQSADPRMNQPGGPGAMEATADEAVMANRPTLAERTRIQNRRRQTKGTGDMVINRDYEGQQVIRDLAEGYTVDAVDLDLDDMSPRLQRLGREWVGERQDQYNTALADRAEAVSQMADLGTVDTSRTQQVVAEQMERLASQDPQEFAELSRLLENWQGIVGNMDMDQALTQLKVIRGHASPVGLTSGTGGVQKNVVREIEQALYDEIDDFAAKAADPEVYGQFRASQEALGDLAQDFQVETLGNLLRQVERGGDIDFASIGDLIKPNTNPEDFSRMVNRLDDQGRERLQDAMMADMLRLADPRVPRTDAFVNQIDLRSPLIQRAFDEDDVDHILTVRRALEAAGVPAQQFNRPGSTEGRTNFGTNPAAGPFVAQQTGRMGPIALLLAEIYERGTGRLARNAQTPEARNLAIRLRNIPEGAAGEYNASRRLIRAILGMDPDAALGADRESTVDERESLRERTTQAEVPLTPVPTEAPAPSLREQRGLPPVQTGRTEAPPSLRERRQ